MGKWEGERSGFMGVPVQVGTVSACLLGAAVSVLVLAVGCSCASSRPYLLGELVIWVVLLEAPDMWSIRRRLC